MKLHLVICDNSERKFIKAERLEKIILAAMKQSLKFELPKLNTVISFSEFLKKEYTNAVYIAHCEKGDKKLLKNSCKTKRVSYNFNWPRGRFFFQRNIKRHKIRMYSNNSRKYKA